MQVHPRSIERALRRAKNHGERVHRPPRRGGGALERLRQAALSPSADVMAGFGVVIGRGVSAWVRVSLAEWTALIPDAHVGYKAGAVSRASVIRRFVDGG